jgi:hypothetical protein
VVSRGAASTSPTVLGDVAATDMRMDKSLKTSMVYSSVVAKIIAEQYGQVDILSNEIYNLFLSCRTFIPQVTSVHSISNVGMSDITPYTQGVNLRMCTIMMSYGMQYRWQDIPPEILLNSIHQTMYTSSSEPEEPLDVREVLTTITPSE